MRVAARMGGLVKAGLTVQVAHAVARGDVKARSRLRQALEAM